MIFHLALYHQKTAVITEKGRNYSYADLSEVSTRIVAKIERNSLVFCLCLNHWASLAGYVGFLNAQHPIVLLDGKKDKDIIQDLIRIYSPRYLWLPTNRSNEFEGHTIAVEEDYSLVELGSRPYPLHPDLSLLLTTSGSTGSPKLVRLTKRNIVTNAKAIADYLGIDEYERAITSLPMYYSFGMSVINSHLVKGATILLTDKAVIQKEFWSFLKEQKGTSLAGVPYTYEILRRLHFFKMDLPDLRTLTQAGGKLNKAITKEFIDYARETGRRFYVMYGQTEAAPRMSYLPFDHAIDKYDSIGIPIPGGKLSVHDINNREIVLTNVDGELVYEGPNVCYGYAECKEDLARGDDNHGVLHTGDIARHDADGYFYITGRMKRFVKIWGNRCNLDATEQLVKNITTNCACVGVDDKITVFITKPGIVDTIRKYLSEKTGLNIRAFDVKVVETIPTKDSGKLDYQTMLCMITK